MPMITAFELDDLVASGESARETDARHRRFGAAVNHANFFDRGNPAANQLRHFDFVWIRDTEAHATLRRRTDGIDYHGRRVTEDGRAPGADIIDVFVAVDVPDFRAGGAVDEEWFAAEIAE